MKAVEKIEVKAALQARKKAAREEGGAVGSLSRGLVLLDLLTRATTFVSLSDLAADAGLDASTTYRLLQILVEQGYAVRDDLSKRYLPGPRALLPLSLFHPAVQLKQEARSVLEFLREQTGETIALALFVGKQRMVVDFVRGEQPLSPYYDTWLQSPLHGSASGKLLLAWLSNDERDDMLGPAPYTAHTAFTQTSASELTDYLEQVRQQEYAVARDDAFEGLIAIGVPLMTQPVVRPFGCLMITASSQSISEAREIELANRLKAAAQLLINSAPSMQSLKNWIPRTIINQSQVIQTVG
jgi:DNA-binding IclR family transcriptional regulator